MWGTFKKPPDHLAALDRLKDWTRARFELADGDAILVRELQSTYPGAVPRETVVGFWTVDRVHHHFKLFKPVVEIIEDDLPPAWLKSYLISDEEGCC